MEYHTKETTLFARLPPAPILINIDTEIHGLNDPPYGLDSVQHSQSAQEKFGVTKSEEVCAFALFVAVVAEAITIVELGIWKEIGGQDLIEYALMAGFVALAAIAAVPGIATSISTVFSKVASTMTAAASTS
jgi:pilus assembly protein Flp/PilA